MIALLYYSFDIFRLVSINDHNHEDPLDSILIGSNEATEDNASTNTPDLSPGLIDTVTTNKFFQLFQNFLHSQGDTADNTSNSAACGISSIPDNNRNGTESVQDKSGDTPQDKCAEKLEQDYKKVVQKDPLMISDSLMCFRILHREFLRKMGPGDEWHHPTRKFRIT